MDLEMLTNLAENGDVEAQVSLGNIYRNSNGIKQDYETAAIWYEKAALQGSAAGQTGLGDMYLLGTKRDHMKAVELYKKAAAQGYVEAEYSLGNMYNSFRSGEDAIEWYKKAANHGHSGAQYRLIDMSRHNYGLKKYLEQLDAAKKGYVVSQNKLGDIYYHGLGTKCDFAMAIEWYEKACKQEYDSSLNSLGDIYFHGHGLVQDYEKARKLYERAFKRGNVLAANSLGNIYFNGYGVDQDYEKARIFYDRAGMGRNIQAQNSIGNIYYHGIGVERDYGRAKSWYRNAAEQEDPCAQNMLGQMFRDGEGVEKDLIIAKMWFEKAASQNNENAIINLKELEVAKIERESHMFNRLGCKSAGIINGSPDKNSANQSNIQAPKILGGEYFASFERMQDYEKAIEWYKKTALDGDLDSQKILGAIYCTDEKRDFAKAMEWYGKAAEQGDDTAKLNLKNLKVVLFIEKAANNGDVEAQNQLGEVYRDGRVTPKNIIIAKKWFKKAAEHGNQRALSNLEDLEKFKDDSIFNSLNKSLFESLNIKIAKVAKVMDKSVEKSANKII